MTDTKSDHDEAAWAAERPDIAHENSYGRFDDFSPPRSDEAPAVSKMEMTGVTPETMGEVSATSAPSASPTTEPKNEPE